MYKISYTGDGATTEYVFAFPFFQVADVHIALDNVAVTSGCTVVPNDDFTGGRVIFTIAKIVIVIMLRLRYQKCAR